MSDPTQILLIRHAQTDWNVRKRWQGQLDVPLNATGLAQARALSARLARRPIAAIYASDLIRAVDTARVLARPHGLAVRLEPGLRERHAGIFHGLTGEELRGLYPLAEARQWLRCPPGGEASDVVRRRVVRLFEALLARHRGDTIALVSHGGTLHELLAHIMEVRPTARGRFMLRGNTGLSVVEVSDGRGPMVTLLNDTSHLEPGDPR